MKLRDIKVEERSFNEDIRMPMFAAWQFDQNNNKYWQWFIFTKESLKNRKNKSVNELDLEITEFWPCDFYPCSEELDNGWATGFCTNCGEPM
ncbi:hypothetical protein [Candidatus Sororendozoicomonas aggregata]|uniref:hypothetical protein n=1 Tax=Candidatus Sororendozoicomonas aggregata TaxID=3073239 RepID=UPI002ED60F8E